MEPIPPVALPARRSRASSGLLSSRSLMRGSPREIRRRCRGRGPGRPQRRTRSDEGGHGRARRSRRATAPAGASSRRRLPDGRIVQLGGEVIGPFHEPYLGLADELGLTIVPSFPQLPGEDTWVLADGRHVGDDFPWMSDADRASFAALSDEFGALASSGRPRRPVVAPRRRAARPALARRLAARPRRHAQRRAGARPRDAGAVGRVGRAHLAAGRAPQGGSRRRERLLQLRGLGVQPRRRRGRPRWRCGWPRSSATGCATARR